MADTQDHIRVPLPITMDPPHFFPKTVEPASKCDLYESARADIKLSTNTFLRISNCILTNGRQLNVECLATPMPATSYRRKYSSQSYHLHLLERSTFMIRNLIYEIPAFLKNKKFGRQNCTNLFFRQTFKS